MSKRKYSRNNIQFWFKRIIKSFRYLGHTIVRSILRLLKLSNRNPKLAKAGFVLPTVTMVMLVVVLLTVAILLRSFDRVEQARNVRVSQAALSAAAPALDRAKAKLQNLLQDQPPVTGTPKDDVLYQTLATGIYRFGDETQLKVRFDLDGNGFKPTGETNELEDDEVISTAWRFPVDTDNNGLYDSFTLYGIFFRNPPRDGAGFERERKPLEARSTPQESEGAITNEECEAALGTSSGIVGDSGWFQSGDKLKKSFFVYTANIPITNKDEANLLSAKEASSADQFENFKGSTGVSALEYQQDRTRIPLTNNAVVYEDDLEISPFPAFRLNGRIITNSNLIVSPFTNTMRLYQVSGKYSCFYEAQNSKIIVGGNVVNGQTGNTTEQNDVTVDLFDGDQQDPIVATLTDSNDSTGNNATQVMYDTQRYANLIDALVDDYFGITTPTAEQRTELENKLKKRARKVPWADTGDVSTATIDGTTVDDVRPNDLWVFSVGNDNLSYDGVNANNLPATNPTPNIQEGKEILIGDRILVGNNLPLETWNGTVNNFEEQYQEEVAGGEWSDGTQRTRTSRLEELPDVGSIARKNNSWDNDDTGFWEKAAAEAPEAALDGIGGLRIVTGAGVYERRNSFLPPPEVYDGTTVSRTYDDPTTTLNVEQYEIVWPDTMPMSPGRRPQALYDNVSDEWKLPGDDEDGDSIPDIVEDVDTLDNNDFADWTDLFNAPGTALANTIDPNTQKYAKGDLRMRATAVYHYAQSPNADQTPIACVSSYYDPTDYDTAQNTGLSDNGIVYGPPPARPTNSLTPNATTGLFTTGTDVLGRLAEQANKVFPDGRFVNELLREALQNTEAERTLAQKGAIDSTACAFGILGTANFGLVGTAPTYIPNDAIKEVAFLNAREVKAIEADNTNPTTGTPNTDEMFSLNNPLGQDTETIIGSNYDLSLEERYPQEIRVTQIDIGLLRNAVVPINIATTPNAPTPEYLLPNSGIIYATRDDALPDRSNRDPNDGNTAIDFDRSELVSPTDYILDPTRRPNGIMLVNGDRLARNDANDDGQNDTAPAGLADVIKEKGLILASNLPVYIQGDFNVHTEEEFNNELDANWADFYTRDGKNIPTGLNDNFACRTGDPRVPACTTGDSWRQATVLADSVTLLSDNFRPGYRNEGNFDLRNNAGDVVVGLDVNGNPITAKQARRKNGFFTNDFVTTGLSSATRFKIDGSTTVERPQDTNYSTPNTFYNSSYFNNFVTPVQRRISFPEYVMEMCRKFPLSSCGPADWVVGYDANGDVAGTSTTGAGDGDLSDSESAVSGDLNGDTSQDTDVFERDVYSEQVINKKIRAIDAINSGSIFRMRLGAGTTTKPPLEPNSQTGATDYPGDQRYARRLAFKRNHYHQLELDEINDSGTFRYTAIPLGVNISVAVKEYSYTAPGTVPRTQNNSLWFRTTTNTTGQPDAAADITYANNRLPYYYFDDNGDGTPDDINDYTDANTNAKRILLPKTPDIEGATTASLGDADTHAICTGTQTVDDFLVFDDIDPPGGTNVDKISGSPACGDNASVGNFITGLPTGADGSITATTDFTLDIADDVDPATTANPKGVLIYNIPSAITSGVITLKGDANTIFILRASAGLAFSGVRVELEGNVDPNNVFWVVYGGDLTFNGGLFTGNFLGTGIVTINASTQILGGRLLGFSSVTTAPSIRVTAMSTQDQPLLVPVLQIRVPKQSPTTAATLPAVTDPNQGNDTAWMVYANPTTYNLVIGSKDTPSRPLETNGGLQNLPRFLENWEDPEQTTEILGSFVQLGRSEYATAPYLQTQDPATPTNLPNSLFPNFTPFSYASGTAGGRIAYQGPPARNWGYDVGLLSQTPDLFAQQFTLRPTDITPDEFYREIGQNDEWIQTLLCAVKEEDDNPAVNSSVRPEDFCDQNTGG